MNQNPIKIIGTEDESRKDAYLAYINDSDGLNLLQSPECLLPDFPATTFSLRRLYSGQTYQSNPIAGVTSNAGWASYFGQSNPASIESVATLLPELPSIVLAGERLLESATAQGLKFSHSPIYEIETDFQSGLYGIYGLVESQREKRCHI